MSTLKNSSFDLNKFLNNCLNKVKIRLKSDFSLNCKLEIESFVTFFPKIAKTFKAKKS